MKSIYPNLVKLSDIFWANLKESSAVEPFQTIGGKKFIKFAKSKSWEVGFYDNVVVPYINSGMIVETWGNGSEGLADPNCTDSDPNMHVLSNLYV